MKLHLEVDGNSIEYRIHPLLVAAGIYAWLASKVASSCGLSGLLVVAGATLLIGAGHLIKTA